MVGVSLTVYDIKCEEYSPQVIKVYDESEVKDLEDAGVEILRRRGDILLCLVPFGEGNEVIIPNSLQKSPKHLSGKIVRRRGCEFNVPTLDKAVAYFEAKDILSGDGFKQSYTGNGVVVGICDIGFDPMHPTFLDENGNSRVKRLTQYVEREGKRLVLEGNDAYREWKTDNAEEYHATHVCGILAGNGAGSSYVGIAKDADIVVSTSTLSDVGLLAGVEDIIEYAKEVEKPAVINLSMGNSLGAHDGSSLFSQYLDMCADDAIIVLSAGNHGSHTNTIHHDFTEAKPVVSFRLGDSKTWTQMEMYGATDIWSGSSEPLSVRISIYDDESKSEVFSYPEYTLFDYDEQTFVWNAENSDSPGMPLEGYLTLSGGVDPENGRYQTFLVYDFKSLVLLDKGWSRYVVKVDVKGKPGQDVDIFADGSYTRLMGIEGSTLPSSSISINDLACGFNVVSVGMYGNRSSWTFTDVDQQGGYSEKSEETGYEAGQTVVHSSYGTLRDGRSLPLTVAPGAPLVSSFSREYAALHPAVCRYESNGIPWISESGTSMASPYVAGFIATWLEAVPELNVNDVQRIIDATNRHDVDDSTNPRNINGWFDPKSALGMALRLDAVEEISCGNSVFVPSEEVDVYSVDGKRVFHGIFSELLCLKGNRIAAFLPEVDLPSGVYVLINKTGHREKIMR